mgnify:CR=1 FL=1
MAVFRVEKNSGYTVMSNHHLRNRALSLKAKGLLSQMLSLPEDWDYTLQGWPVSTGKAIGCEYRQAIPGNWNRQATSSVPENGTRKGRLRGGRTM